MHRIAGESDGDGPQFQPADDDGVGLGRRLQRLAVFGGIANLVIQFRAAGAQRDWVGEPAFAFHHRTRPFDRVSGEESTQGPDAPVILRLVGDGGDRDLVQLMNGTGAVVLRIGDFRGNQRARGRQARAGVRRHAVECLFGGGDVAGGQPLFGAQQFVVVMSVGSLGRELRIGARRVRMLAGLRQCLSALLLVFGSLCRLEQAAGSQQQRCRKRREQR